MFEGHSLVIQTSAHVSLSFLGRFERIARRPLLEARSPRCASSQLLVGLGDDRPWARRHAALLMPPASFAAARPGGSAALWGSGSSGTERRPGLSQTRPVAKAGGEVRRASACTGVIRDTFFLCPRRLFTQRSPAFHCLLSAVPAVQRMSGVPCLLPAG